MILDLDVLTLYRLTITAKEAERRAEAREQWCSMLPFMSLKLLKFVSFDDYYGQISGRDFDLRPDEEILAEVEEIRKQLQGA